MQVTILSEAGYAEALYSLSLSFKRREIPMDEWWTLERAKKMEKTLAHLSTKGASHAKVLRQIMLWLDIEAPRFFWSEFDTYKVGTVAHSESTMHTLSKRPLTASDCEGEVPDTIIAAFNEALEKKVPIDQLKALLPEGYLQRRVVTLNYQTLRTIIAQRKSHRLPQWHTFINAVYAQCEHPELLQEIKYE